MEKDPKNTVIEAAGGIVWRETKEGPKLALVHRPKYDDWSLPKGKLKKKEGWQAAALREVREETSCEVELDSFAGSIAYTVEGIPKVVLFWNMKTTKVSSCTPNKEINEVVWVTQKEALEKLDYEIEKNLLRRSSR
ncbi:MAG: putative 8-oxo-dGTP diphosphatase 1 [Chloroflexi bacterium]|nr:putative 8-oxo-dGTP diphosphatase 1 [Chloroflexota bacterium]